MRKVIPIMEPDLSGNEKEFLMDAVDSGWISSKGKYVDLLEEKLASYHQVNHALVVSNGTVALHLGLVSLGIGTGDEVIVPNLTFASSVNSILHAGATPVLAEVNERTFNIDCDKVESYISPKTRAIMPVHLYGNPCNMDEIKRIAEKHNLLIIEDNAEALGSKYKSNYTGTIGDIGTYSFYGNKTITTGEGGAILFRDEKTYQTARVLRDHGMNPEKRYWHDHIGFNYRMTNMQASIGCAQMERIDQILEKKRDLANRYMNEFSNIDAIKFQESEPDSINSYWLITPIFQDTSVKRLSNFLSENGIETRPAFYPISAMPVYAPYSKSEYPVSESISRSGLSLPSFPSIKDEEVDHVIQTVRKFYE